ncbi:hypothetical protein MTO96_019197 [Rhipicephalus appendiculatus]
MSTQGREWKAGCDAVEASPGRAKAAAAGDAILGIPACQVSKGAGTPAHSPALEPSCRVSALPRPFGFPCMLYADIKFNAEVSTVVYELLRTCACLCVICHCACCHFRRAPAATV